MRLSHSLYLLLVSALVFSLAHAAEPVNGWKSSHGAIYLIHGGSLADRQLPTAKDKKLSIAIYGHSAKEIFNSIGPDLPHTCTDEKGDRERARKGISCTFIAQDKATKNGGYRCWIGIDLKTGDSVGTGSC